MRHGVDGRKFGRNTPHRLAMFRNMTNSVIEKEQIVTTLAKAKEIRRSVDKLITLAKRGNSHSRRMAFDRTRNDLVVKKLFDTLVDRYKARPGGYTRVLKMTDRRQGDGAEMAVLELVDHAEIKRKRVKKATDAKSETGTEGTEKAVAPVDPFNRFRKLFSGSKGAGVAGKQNQKSGGPKSTTRKKLGD